PHEAAPDDAGSERGEERERHEERPPEEPPRPRLMDSAERRTDEDEGEDEAADAGPSAVSDDDIFFPRPGDEPHQEREEPEQNGAAGEAEAEPVSDLSFEESPPAPDYADMEMEAEEEPHTEEERHAEAEEMAEERLPEFDDEFGEEPRRRERRDRGDR